MIGTLLRRGLAPTLALGLGACAVPGERATPLQRPALVFNLVPATDPEPTQPGPLTASGLTSAGDADAGVDAMASPAVAVGSPPATASPAPGPAGAAGGGSSGGSSTPHIDGEVLSVAGESETPLAGATVRALDGRSASTDAAGRFTLTGAPDAQGVYLASAPGHVPAAIAGYVDASAMTFHLKAAAPLLPGPTGAPASRFAATGLVVDAQGLPVPDVLVMVADATGTSSNPATSAADGSFTLVIEAAGGRVEAGNLLAVDTRGRWLGLATGLTIAGEGDVIDAVPGTPGDDPLALVAATHEVRLSLDRTAFAGPAPAGIELVAPDGSSLGLYGAATRVMAANLPDARYDLRVDGLDATSDTRSVILRHGLPLDFATDHTDIAEALLAPPEFSPPPTLVPGDVLAWRPVTGARGYGLTLSDLDGGTAGWEGFSFAPSLPFQYPAAALASGRYSLELQAWDADGLTPRSVAALGPSQLRITLPPAGYRRSSRRVIITR